MDIIVTTNSDEKEWTMSDLLGRDMGRVREAAVGAFVIEPAGQAVETMRALTSKPYASLDEALAAIEEQTRGVCRRAS